MHQLYLDLTVLFIHDHSNSWSLNSVGNVIMGETGETIQTAEEGTYICSVTLAMLPVGLESSAQCSATTGCK